jgi:hypothetical protein
VIVAVDQMAVDVPSTLTTVLIGHHPGGRVTFKMINPAASPDGDAATRYRPGGLNRRRR